MSPALPTELASERMQRMRASLTIHLAPTQLELVDESHKHVGHAGARDGRGHFALSIVSSGFTGLPMLARHRLVYAALGEMMNTDIHALSIKAFAPSDLGAKDNAA